MSLTFFDRIPTNLPGGFFVYRATGAEELCFADRNVLDLYGCRTMEEFREYTGNSFRGMVFPEDLERVENEIYAQTFKCGERHDYVQYRIRTKQGGIKYVEDFGHLVYDSHGDNFFYVFIGDVEESEYRKMDKSGWEAARVGFRHAENRNALTGLMYEKPFYAACERNLANVKINWLLFAIDLQHFKLFNEWYGRALGDHVLRDIGQALSGIAESHGGVAGYMGGDDFALLVPTGRFNPDALFDSMQGIISEHGVSIGFLPSLGACYSNGKASIYQLYDEATLACQEAKKDYKRRVVFFSSSLVE